MHSLRVWSMIALVVALGGCANSGSVQSSALPATTERSDVATLDFAQLDASTASTNLIKDGGFETPAAPAGGLSRYSSGQKLGPWSVIGPSGGTVDVLSYTFSYDGYTFHPKSGGQQVDLTGDSNVASGVQQSVATVKGKKYTLTFYVGNVIDENGGLGTSSTVIVSLNGKQLVSATNSHGLKAMLPDWEQFSVTFAATSSTATLSFVNADPSNDTYNGLDDVVLTENN